MSESADRPIFARFYAWVSPRMDAGGMAELRAEALAGVSGRVLELGAGNGLNFRHYPTQVTQVLAVEPEPRLRRLAERAAADACVPVRVVAGTAQRLPAEDAEYDTAVCSMVLCSVPDQAVALHELRRVLRAGGELRVLEHVRAPGAGLRRVQRLLDRTIWPTLCGGCHVGRDTTAALVSAGFAVDRLEGRRFPVTRVPLPNSPHIVGVATRID